MNSLRHRGIGNLVAPMRFVAFAIIAVAGSTAGIMALGWRHGLMAGFDAAAFVFLASCVPLLDNPPDSMRRAARRNDANRAGLLAVTGAVMGVILIVVASELMQKGAPGTFTTTLIIVTLALAWLFSNMVYALHYAHLFYTSGKDDKDCGGLEFPDTKEPDYWDFVYYSFCLGMTFQTSDVSVTTRHFRRVTTFHCLAAFVFNIGVLAFTINVLGG